MNRRERIKARALERRKLATGGEDTPRGRAISGVASTGISVFRTVKGAGKRKPRTAVVGYSGRATSSNQVGNPTFAIAKAISNALDPTQAPGKVRTLSQMGSEERAKLEAELGARISTTRGPAY